MVELGFYNESNLKDTHLGSIPEEWSLKKISELFTIETGMTPSTRAKEYWEKGSINWITPTDLSEMNGKIYIFSSKRKITETAFKENNLALLPSHSIILSTR